MANVVQSPVDFYPRPISHSPKPFGFGFGLNASSPPWPNPTTPGHTNPSSFHQLASSINQQSPPSRVQKRRLEHDDDEASGRGVISVLSDQSMDRSPTPERPKRAVPKRARVVFSDGEEARGDTGKEVKTQKEDDVDVGVLLASLPPQSLLPILTSLLNAQPSLKATILPLIPRPNLDVALQALAQSAKKLRDAYPYSNAPPVHTMSSATGFGFGSRVNSFGTFGRPTQPPGHLEPSTSGQTGGMRDSYIVSRLRPHIHEFISACMSYLPYFSYLPPPTASSSQPSSASNGHADTRSHSNVIHSLSKDKSHPTETYSFLAALTTHLLSQPSLTQSSLAPLLLPRLVDEWKAWVDKVDRIVNHEGGMFGSETVSGWVRGLDGFAESKGPEGFQVMREIRDQWVGKVGWLVGRVPHHPMEESWS